MMGLFDLHKEKGESLCKDTQSEHYAGKEMFDLLIKMLDIVSEDDSTNINLKFLVIPIKIDNIVKQLIEAIDADKFTTEQEDRVVSIYGEFEKSIKGVLEEINEHKETKKEN